MWTRIVSGAFATLVVMACGTPRDPFAAGDSTIQAATGDVALHVDQRSCVDSVARRGRLVLLASRMPLGFRNTAEAQDSAWTPTQVVEVLSAGSSIAVFDAGQLEVTIFDTLLRPIRSFGRPGAGPGEFRQILAAASDERATIYVADSRNGRLTSLDTAGGVHQQWPLSSYADLSGLAASDGRVALARFVLPERLTRVRGAFTVLSDLETVTGDQHALWSIVRDTLDDRRFPLPGPNSFKVARGSGTTVLFAPASATVAVYREGQRLSSFQLCMPPALKEAYALQRQNHASGRTGNSQQELMLVSDAMLLGDTIYFVGPLRDQRRRFHVDRVTVRGENLGSWVANLGDIPFPRDIRFLRTPREVVAFGPGGTLMRYGLEWLP